MAQRLEIGIIGGSIGGLFAAVLLTQAGHSVTVLERSRTGLGRRGAGLVAQQELFDILDRTGLRAAASEGVVARERITLNRRGDVVFRDPTPQTQLSWDTLYEAFRSQIPGDRYLLDHAALGVSATDADRAAVQLHTGRTLEFDAIIGADGLGSVTRSAVAPRQHSNTYVGYVTWRGLVPEKDLPPLAARVLLDRFAFFTAPHAHMLGYLVPGAGGEIERGLRRYNWVWYRSLTPDGLESIMTKARRPPGGVSLAPGDLPTAERADLVAAAEAELPPAFAEAVAAEPDPFLQAIFDYVPPRMVRGRVALLGDAAAVVRPHTAMGAAKAAGDAMTLADLLDALPVDEALARYDQTRLPVARAIAAYGRQLGESLPL
ncbi:FAD-dependent monooxygenase [Microbacterium sp. P05]|uniref:FAD binding domain-containing protein n=1 Tax=Microbacterium sp. P05 TaxID=3366948 RepID=UPI0037464255